MYKLIISLTFFVCSLSCFAQTNKPKDPNELIKLGNKMVARKDVQEMLRRANHKKTGGHIRKQGTASGYVVLLNNQSKVELNDINSAIETLDKQVKVQIKVLNDSKVNLFNAMESIKKAGAQVGVILLDDNRLPALLSAPEEGWSIVNVAKLHENHEESVLPHRARREVLRAFGLAAGAMYAAHGDFVLQPIRKPSDLDSLKREEFGISMLRIFPLSLPYYGITPWYQTTYSKACEEGWAPAPTNEFQKAIWDKVHAMPTAPIKIKPENKKVTE